MPVATLKKTQPVDPIIESYRKWALSRVTFPSNMDLEVTVENGALTFRNLRKKRAVKKQK